MRHRYKIDGETIKYVNVMSLPIRMQMKFPIGHPAIHVDDACQDMKPMLLKEEEFDSPTEASLPSRPTVSMQ